VALLTWEGLTGSVAKWQSHRWVHVWRGRLYLAAHRDDAEALLSKAYWMGYRVVQLQPSVSTCQGAVSGFVMDCLNSAAVSSGSADTRAV